MSTSTSDCPMIEQLKSQLAQLTPDIFHLKWERIPVPELQSPRIHRPDRTDRLYLRSFRIAPVRISCGIAGLIA